MTKKPTKILLYLIISKEDYNIDLFLSFLEQKLGFRKEEMTKEVYHRDETDLTLVLDSALNLPMFANRKLILMKYATEFLLSDIPLLSEYLDHPSPQTIFVITAREINKKSSLWEKFQSRFRKVTFPSVPVSGTKAIWINFPKHKSGEEGIFAWIKTQFFEKGLEIDKKALGLFYEICGKDRLVMLSEIEKLASFKENRSKVAIKDVEEIAAENKVFDIYALLEFICCKERAKAIGILRNLLESRKNHSFIIWHLENYFSKLAIAKKALQSGDNDQIAARKAGEKYYTQKLIHNARLVHEDLIKNAPALILQADRLMKSAFPEDIILEKLVFDLT